MTKSDWNHKYAELPGLKVHYVRHAKGLPVILQHGWPEFWYVFHKNIPELAEHFDIIVPDLRGFGDSDKPETTPGIDDYVADLKAFVDHLELDRVGIVTHDVGPWIVQPFARQNPDRVAGIFFFDCPYPGIGDRYYAPDHINPGVPRALTILRLDGLGAVEPFGFGCKRTASSISRRARSRRTTGLPLTAGRRRGPDCGAGRSSPHRP